MNPYPERIAELHSHLASVWSQRDTQATEILLAALLPASLTRMRRPWIVIETDYLSRDTRDAWFSLGIPDTVQARSLAVCRVMRREPGHDWVESTLRERTRDVPGVFTDAEWRRLPYGSYGWTRDPRASYYTLMSQCVKLRVAHPKGDTGVRQDRERDIRELGRLARRALDNAYRDPRDADGAMPKSFYYWCELVQKVAQVQADWEVLTGSLAAIARGIAYLYNDGRAPDWTAAERVLRDCVPYATGWLIREAAKSPAAAHAMYSRSGGDILSYERVPLELKRLHREGALAARKARKVVASSLPWRYRVSHKDWETLLDRDARILI